MYIFRAYDNITLKEKIV